LNFNPREVDDVEDEIDRSVDVDVDDVGHEDEVVKILSPNCLLQNLLTTKIWLNFLVSRDVVALGFFD
jgi:hypothetical protein